MINDTAEIVNKFNEFFLSTLDSISQVTYQEYLTKLITNTQPEIS